MHLFPIYMLTVLLRLFWYIVGNWTQSFTYVKQELNQGANLSLYLENWPCLLQFFILKSFKDDPNEHLDVKVRDKERQGNWKCCQTAKFGQSIDGKRPCKMMTFISAHLGLGFSGVSTHSLVLTLLSVTKQGAPDWSLFLWLHLLPSVLWDRLFLPVSVLASWICFAFFGDSSLVGNIPVQKYHMPFNGTPRVKAWTVVLVITNRYVDIK